MSAIVYDDNEYTILMMMDDGDSNNDRDDDDEYNDDDDFNQLSHPSLLFPYYHINTTTHIGCVRTRR